MNDTNGQVHGEEAIRAATRIRWRERILRFMAPVLELGPRARGWTDGAPVFLYHRVRDDHEKPRDPFSVTRRAFDAQVAFLEERFRLVTVAEIADRMRAGKDVASLAAISFDDGYDCTFRNAWPVLRARGAPATVYVDTGRLDGPRPALSRRELRTMADEGLEVGSHTVSHPIVTELSEEQLRTELESSAAVIREIVGRRPRGFAYPFGRYDRGAADLVRRAGYEYACTCRQDRTNHPGDDPYLMARVEINEGDRGRRFARKVRGVYAPAYALLYGLRTAATR